MIRRPNSLKSQRRPDRTTAATSPAPKEINTHINHTTIDCLGSEFSIRPFVNDDFLLILQMDRAMTLELMGCDSCNTRSSKHVEEYCYDKSWLRSITETERTSHLQWRTLVATSLSPSDKQNRSRLGIEEHPKHKRARTKISNEGIFNKEVKKDIAGGGRDVTGAVIIHEQNETRCIKRKKVHRSYVELFFLYVFPNHRKEGVASRLVRYIIDNYIPAEFSRATEIRLHVLKENTVAINFYGKLGFRTTALKKDYPSEGFDSYRMVLPL